MTYEVSEHDIPDCPPSVTCKIVTRGDDIEAHAMLGGTSVHKSVMHKRHLTSPNMDKLVSAAVNPLRAEPVDNSELRIMPRSSGSRNMAR